MKEFQQDKILSMHEDGLTPREIQDELGCSIGSIYSTLAKFSLVPNQKRCPHCGGRLLTSKL